MVLYNMALIAVASCSIEKFAIKPLAATLLFPFVVSLSNHEAHYEHRRLVVRAHHQRHG